MLDVEELTVTNAKGTLTTRPAARLPKATERNLLKLLPRLRLDPESRTPIGTPISAAVVNIANLFETRESLRRVHSGHRRSF